MGEVWHPVWHLVWHTPPRRGGSLPSVCIPAGRLSGPHAGRTSQPHRSARCLTHSSAPSWSSAASVPRAPGRGRACSPRPTPWPSSSATTRRTCTRRSSPGTTSRPAWPCSSRANFSSARRGSGSARMGVSLGLRSRLPAWPLSPTATGPGIVDGEVHPPVRAIEGCVATFKKRQERDWSSRPGFDTVVVPAQQEGFESTFLGQNCWYAIRIAGGMLDKIKYIAAYQTNPVSAITHYAPVSPDYSGRVRYR